MKKTMFHRFGALALSMMMAFSLMAVPAFAVTDNPDVPNLTISGAINDVRYDVYPLLVLANQTGDSYEYKLATDENGNPTDAAKAVQGVINGFLAKDNNGYGFELVNGNRVVFRVVPQEVTETNPETSEETKRTETMDEAYTRWEDSADGRLFLTKFADAVKDAAEKGVTIGEETKSLGNPFASVTDNGANDLNEAVGTIEVDLGTGYYLVISSAGQRAMVSTQGSEGATINEKNKAPTLEKTVGEYADGSFKPKNDAAVGDVVSFRVVIEARKGVNNLTFTDTLSSGLTFDRLMRVRFVPLKAGAKKSDIEFDMNGYPTSTEKIREVYTDSVPTNGTNFNDTDKGIVNLWKSGEPNNNMLTVSLPSSDTEKTIQIVFKPQWLNSMRSEAWDNEGAGTEFNRDPMEANDDRLGHWGEADQNAALYNMYIGDVSDPEDDGGLILIDYKATLNDNAIVGGTGNTNDAKLTYGNDPDTKLTVETSPTHTYTYKLDVHKYEKDNDSNALKGAKFDLYRLNDVKDGELAGVTEIGTAEGSPVRFVPGTGEGATAVPAKVVVDAGLIRDKIEGDAVRTDDGKNEFTRIKTGLATGDDGMVAVERLDAGLYVLVETDAPDGYIKAEKPIYAVIGGVYTNSATVDDNNAVDSNVFVQTAAGSNTFELSADKDPVAATAERVGVANASGLVMPSTGGIGTTIFYAVGGLLVAGAGVLLVLRKRGDRSGE